VNRAGAQTAVALSAFWVALLFGYRKLATGAIVDPKQIPSTAHFLIGFGFTYIVLAMIAQAAPPAGGMFAVLVATGDTLANGQAIFADVQTGLKATSTATGGR
jgi:hypothetical protein